jgi:hypothetical protein
MDRHGRRASDMWSFTDFVHLMSLVLPGRRTRKALDDLFDVFDADLSGTLSLAELVQEMGKMHPLRECAPRPPLRRAASVSTAGGKGWGAELPRWAVRRRRRRARPRRAPAQDQGPAAHAQGGRLARLL